LEAQVCQGGQHPVTEDQLVVRAGADGTPAWVATALVHSVLVGGGPRVGELGGQLAKVLPRQPGKGWETAARAHAGPDICG
jgi:hypothetical protein